MTIGYERRTGKNTYSVTIPYVVVVALIVGALAAYGGYLAKPSEVISTTTRTVQNVSTQVVTATITSTVTTTPQNPQSLILYGSISTSSGDTFPTKLNIEDDQGKVVKTFDLTTTSSHSYNATLTNGGVYYFHVYWSSYPIGAGDKICATLHLIAGPGTSSIRLDLNC